MDYHRKVTAGLIDRDKQEAIRAQLENVQRILKPVRTINPYAIYIDLPLEVFKPRRTLPLLLSFIEAITYYHQYQREELADENGEVYIETTVEDIEWGFQLLGDVLFRKSDELSGACREFYEGLKRWGKEHQTTKFHGKTLRSSYKIHPRTLNRYLHELTEFGRLQIIGGNKHQTGYEYELIPQHLVSLQDRIDRQINAVLDKIRQAHLERTTKVKRKKSA
jgi:DNA-binding HxlR family transcriptional regulator